MLGGDAPLGIVPQLGEPLADGPAERNLRQIIVRYGVLGSDPGGRGLGIVVFEPTVGVGHDGAEVVVDHLAARGVGIGPMLDLFPSANNLLQSSPRRPQGARPYVPI